MILKDFKCQDCGLKSEALVKGVTTEIECKLCGGKALVQLTAPRMNRFNGVGFEHRGKEVKTYEI